MFLKRCYTEFSKSIFKILVIIKLIMSAYKFDFSQAVEIEKILNFNYNNCQKFNFPIYEN